MDRAWLFIAMTIVAMPVAAEEPPAADFSGATAMRHLEAICDLGPGPAGRPRCRGSGRW